MNSQPSTLSLMPEGSLSNTYFLDKAYHNLHALRNSEEYFITTLEGYFKYENHQQKTIIASRKMFKHRIQE